MEGKIERPVTENQVVHEMIETEKSYNAALGLLENALQQEKIIGNHPLLIECRGHVSILKNISDSLLKNVESAVRVENTDFQRTALKVQRNQLLKAFFQAYKHYSEFYTRFADEDFVVKKSKIEPNPFTQINQYLHSHSPNKLRLADHLIMPVQRGPRYAMLVAATKKVNDHLDEVHLKEFKELNDLITDFLIAANSSMPKEPETAPGYQVGDLTRYVYGRLFRPSEPVLVQGTTQEEVTEPKGSTPPKPYRFGDYTRSWFKKADGTQSNVDIEDTPDLSKM